MLKSQHEMLCDLKALHLTAIANESSREFLRGYVLALLAVATHWNVEKEFLEYVHRLGPVVLPAYEVKKLNEGQEI